MCGIFGYFDQGRSSLDAASLEAMGESLIHRGPNDVGIHQGKGVALGNRRLSVIDIACETCRKSRYVVTSACRGCLVRPMYNGTHTGGT